MLQAYKDLNFSPIFNVKAAPDYNAIENVFSVVKAAFKKARLHCLANDRPVDYNQEIGRAFRAVKLKDVQSMI